MTLQDCISRLERIAPPALAESWDNVGLLIGERADSIRRVMTCLTLTPDVAREAINGQVDLVVTHHPVLFRAVQRLTDDTAEGAMLLDLVRNRVNVYCPHTAYDSSGEGINQQIAEGLGLVNIAPLRQVDVGAGVAETHEPDVPCGAGRIGRLMSSIPLSQFIQEVRQLLESRGVQHVGDPDRRVSTVAVACGSAGEFLPDAVRLGCDVFLTGEARFHSGLEARDSGIALVLAGHYATERPAIETLAERINEEWTGIEAWPSRAETDPFQWTTP